MHTTARTIELPSFSIYRLGIEYVCVYTQPDNMRGIRLSYTKNVCFQFTLKSFSKKHLLYAGSLPYASSLTLVPL